MKLKEDYSDIIINYNQLLNNIPSAILLIDSEYNILFINYAAEILLSESSNSLAKKNLENFLPIDNPLYSLINQVLKQGYSATQYDISINDFNKKNLLVDVEAGIYKDNAIILCIHKRAIAEQIDRSVAQKNIHSVSGLSALMAHEINHNSNK